MKANKALAPLLLFGVLAAAALTTNVVTLPGNVTVTVTATSTVLNGTTYVIRTIVYNGTTAVDTITVLPGTPAMAKIQVMLKKMNTTAVLPLTVRVQMRAQHGMTNTTMTMGMNATNTMTPGMGAGMGTQGGMQTRGGMSATTTTITESAAQGGGMHK